MPSPCQKGRRKLGWAGRGREGSKKELLNFFFCFSQHIQKENFPVFNRSRRCLAAEGQGVPGRAGLGELGAGQWVTSMFAHVLVPAEAPL